jgi:hypothetical protein
MNEDWQMDDNSRPGFGHEPASIFNRDGPLSKESKGSYPCSLASIEKIRWRHQGAGKEVWTVCGRQGHGCALVYAGSDNGNGQLEDNASNPANRRGGYGGGVGGGGSLWGNRGF